MIELWTRYRELFENYDSSTLIGVVNDEMNKHICSICKNQCGWCIKCGIESCCVYFHPCCILSEYRNHSLALSEDNLSYCCIRHLVDNKVKRKRDYDDNSDMYKLEEGDDNKNDDDDSEHQSKRTRRGE